MLTQDEATKALRDLENVSNFSKRSKIPRRTLVKIISGEGNIRDTTLMLLDQALKRIKPKRKA